MRVKGFGISLFGLVELSFGARRFNVRRRRSL